MTYAVELDHIFVNGRFITQDEKRPDAHAIGVLNGRIVAIDEQLEVCTARRRTDLGGHPVVPGFNDAHQHVSMRGQRHRNLDLRADVVPTLDALYAAVAEFARNNPGDGWIHGSGYDQNKIGGHPDADDLDHVANGRPVWLAHVSAPMGVANTRAFELAGFSDRRGVPDIDGGHVDRDEVGRCSGLLQEIAQRIVTDTFLPLALDEVVENMRVGSELGLAEGLTSATEPGIGVSHALGSSPLDLHAFHRAREVGALKVRMTVMPYITALHSFDGLDDSGLMGLDLGLRTGFGDEFLRIGPTKISTDGSLIGRSAFMKCCYEDEAHNRGFLQFDEAEARDLIVKAHQTGWTVAAHAIGDAAVDLALDAFAAAQAATPRPGVRHRIEHFAVASDMQVARLVALGVLPIPQGRFISELGDGMMTALGSDRSNLCYRMRSLVDKGIELAGSSDAPIAHGSPLLNIHDMVNRRTASGQVLGPEECLTPAQALRAYTIGSAYAVGEERCKGRLTHGQLADFTVLSDNILTMDATQIARTSVGATVINGEVEFNSGAATEL